jgi:hypothetical protein
LWGKLASLEMPRIVVLSLKATIAIGPYPVEVADDGIAKVSMTRINERN